MPTYGQFETAQRLFLSGVGGLYAVKGDEHKVIKVMHPPLGIWSQERVQEEIDAFRLRAKVQKAVAGKSKYWAPVYETAAIRELEEGEGSGGAAIASGATSGGGGEGRPAAMGAYAVMDRYERSVQSLIDGRVNVNNADLRAIFSGVMQGLLDLKQAAAGVGGGGARAHGALKASNILLANSADLAGATVHLTDPAPDGAITAGSEAKDLADVGRILYQLVNLRPYDDGTIGRNKDWEDLGPNGEDWRKLCNALLDPQAPADERDLAKILGRIATWTAKPKRSKKPIFAAVAAVLLIVGGVAAYFTFRTPPVLFDQTRWETLTLAYYSWFDDFFGEMKPDIREKYRKPPYPIEVVRLLDEAGKDLDKFDPRDIARDTGREWAPRITAPTDYVKNGDGPRYTQKSLELVQRVAEAFTPTKWPVLTKLEETAERYEAMGWLKPAGGIRAVIAAARVPEIPEQGLIAERIKKVEEDRDGRKEQIFQSVERTITAAKSVEEIDARWARIQEQLRKVPTGKVALLEGLGEFAAGLPKSNATADDPGTLKDVTALAEAFGAIEKVVGDLNAALGGKEVNFQALADDPAAKGKPSVAAYAVLAKEAPGYVVIADTRDVKGWRTRLGTIQKDMIDEIAKEAPAGDAQLTGIKAAAMAAGDVIEKCAGMVLILKYQKEMADASAAVKATLDRLYEDCDKHPAYINQGKFETFLALQKARYSDPKQLPESLAAASKPVKDTWVAAQTALVKAVGEKTLAEFRKTHVADEEKFQVIERFYGNLEGALPREGADRTALLEAFGKETPWGKLAQHVADNYRESGLMALLKRAATVPENPMGLDSAEYKALKAASRGDYEKACRDAKMLFGDFATIMDRLDRLDLQANEPAQGAAGWRELFAKWASGTGAENLLLKDTLIAAAVDPLKMRVAEVQKLDGVVSYTELLDKAQSGAAEIALTAWRKLGTAPVTEDIPALDDEDKAEAGLKARIEALPAGRVDDARKKRIESEIAVQRPVRWHRWADGLKGAAAIQKALEKAEAFGVTLNPQTDATMIYNRAFFGIKNEFAKGKTEAELKPIARKFIDDVTAMPAAIVADAGVKDLLARMEKSLSPNQGESSANGAGPQLAKWEMDSSREGLRTFYYPTKANAKHTLEFVKMQVTVSGVQKTVYLCTTEMSVGLFMDVMNTSGKMDDVDNDKHVDSAHWFKVPAQRSQDVFLANGVRSWRIENRQFMLNDKWLDDAGPKMSGEPYYPAGAEPAAPAAGDPMQLITPWAAMYGARLLGCRLPTSEEWLAAYNEFEKTSPTAPTWNLRGEGSGRPTWRTQQDHARQLDLNGQKGLPYPDKGIFLPTKFLFSDISGSAAKPWTGDAISKIAPGRISPGTGAYQNNTLWFMPVDKENLPAGATKPVLHHLAGNVAEYVFDGDNATAVVPNNTPTTNAIDDAIKAAATKLFVIGGSSLSPPDIPFNEKQAVNPSAEGVKKGYCDVGFRLTYTAPIDSIVDVLANAFKEPKYLPGPKAKM